MQVIKPVESVCAAVLVLSMAFTAVAGPGDGTVVVIDQPSSPDLLIQDVREENEDATHAPISVRIVVPQAEGEGTPLQWAHVTVYLTSTLSGSDAPRLTEASVKLGPQWADRSIVIDVPSPGPGEYFVHIDGKLGLAGKDDVEITVDTMQRVRFGVPEKCDSVKGVPIPDAGECPLLFDSKGTVVLAGSRAAENEKILDQAVELLSELCDSDSLHRVSVRGWASVDYSDDPPNEVLAQERAKAVVSALQDRLPDCKTRIYNDSVSGAQGATAQFGKAYEANRCAQIQITRHTCENTDDSGSAG